MYIQDVPQILTSSFCERMTFPKGKASYKQEIYKRLAVLEKTETKDNLTTYIAHLDLPLI